MINSSLKIGDVVSRLNSAPYEPRYRGRVVNVYESKPNGLGQTQTLYAVQWDPSPGGAVERGYFETGLVKIVS